jgi:hypothetical protein
VKVAYIFATSGHTASFTLGTMILPQQEEGRSGVAVVGMFFFDDRTFMLPMGSPMGKIAREHGRLLLLYSQCASERDLAIPIGEVT